MSHLSTSQQPGLSQTRVTLALATLFVGTFVLGTAELGVVGMLNLISDDLGVSISAVGTLVTAYALGLAIGGPILAALTIRSPGVSCWPRHWSSTSRAPCSPW